MESPSEPIQAGARMIVPHVLCHACGYEPPALERTPQYCPKCGGGSWEQFVFVGKIVLTVPANATTPGARPAPRRSASHRAIRRPGNQRLRASTPR